MSGGTLRLYLMCQVIFGNDQLLVHKFDLRMLCNVLQGFFSKKIWGGRTTCLDVSYKFPVYT